MVDLKKVSDLPLTLPASLDDHLFDGYYVAPSGTNQPPQMLVVSSGSGYMFEFQRKLPQFVQHRPVGALKIVSMDVEHVGRFHWVWKLRFEEEGFSPFYIEDNWVKAHKVQVGGYLLQRDDKFISYASEHDFRNDYSREVDTVTFLGLDRWRDIIHGYSLRFRGKRNG
jgi:hypothetical protein